MIDKSYVLIVNFKPKTSEIHTIQFISHVLRLFASFSVNLSFYMSGIKLVKEANPSPSY